MDKWTINILDSVNDGLAILDHKFQPVFWNKSLEKMVEIKREDALGLNIFDIFPNLDRPYFRTTFDIAIKQGHQYFFSSKIHRDIIYKDSAINLKINRVENQAAKYLLMEFTDITNQCIRIQELEDYLNELSILNKRLKEQEKEIKKLAYYDSLTGVSNRALFYEVSEKFLANAKRSKTILGLMFVDIDKFKRINDKYGHATGDQVLIETASLLTRNVRDTDMVSRIGGDEFLILLPGLDDYESYRDIARRINEESRGIQINNEIDLDLPLSIGVSFYPRDGKTVDELVLRADKAMYAAKERGGCAVSYADIGSEGIPKNID